MSDFLSNIFFWVFVVGVVGGYLTLRAANHFRDRAAFADYPDRPEKHLLRARIFYGLFVVFLLAIITGMGIVVFQVLQVVRPPAVEPAETAVITSGPTATAAASTTPTDGSITATPRPTALPTDLPPATAGPLIPAVVGNTNFQGVNCRETASADGKILLKLVNGTPLFIVNGVTVEADGLTWQQVQLEDGRTGWIVADFLILVTPVPNP